MINYGVALVLAQWPSRMHFWGKPKPVPEITMLRPQMKQKETWATTQEGAGLDMDQTVHVGPKKHPTERVQSHGAQCRYCILQQ